MSRSGQIMLGLALAGIVILAAALWLHSCEGMGPDKENIDRLKALLA